MNGIVAKADRLLQVATIVGLGSSQTTAPCFPVANVSSLTSRRESHRHREAVPCPIRENVRRVRYEWHQPTSFSVGNRGDS